MSEKPRTYVFQAPNRGALSVIRLENGYYLWETENAAGESLKTTRLEQISFGKRVFLDWFGGIVKTYEPKRYDQVVYVPSNHKLYSLNGMPAIFKGYRILKCGGLLRPTDLEISATLDFKEFYLFSADQESKNPRVQFCTGNPDKLFEFICSWLNERFA